MRWVSPNTITGDAATEYRYFRREYINELFWHEVKKGNHILFVAPRRVGKSSIMIDLAEHPPEGYACIYQNIEGVTTRNEFYQRLFNLILQCIHRSPVKSAQAFVERCFKKYCILEITKMGVKLEKTGLNYEAELRNLVPELKEAKIHTVIFLDEFAEVINKLNKAGHELDAISIMHTLREIRSDKDFEHFTLVFAGSIGLHYIIKSIDRPKLINDLHPIESHALTRDEAAAFIRQLTKVATIQISDEVLNYLLNKVGHLLPYYIQLMLEEIDMIAREKSDPKISPEMVDNAFTRVLHRNKNFDDWLVRLRSYQDDRFPFINHILKHAAHRNKITVQEIYNLALDEKYNREDDYMDSVEQLLNEGYLIQTDDHTYTFVSPFLQKFWLKKFPVYYV